MTYLKKYYPELLFLMSFCLPFYKVISINDGVKSVYFLYGFNLIARYYPAFLVSVMYYLLFLKYKKPYLKKLAIISYLFFIALGITGGDILNVPPLQYYSLFTYIVFNYSLIGFHINFLLYLLLSYRLLFVRGDV